MKLEQKEIDFIENVVKTARIVGIDNIIIEPDSVRAIDDASSVVLLQKDIPEMSFDAVGLNRTETFLARFNVVKDRENFTMIATKGDSEFVRSFTMKGKGVSVDYRCANPTTIRAPKKVNDGFAYRIQLNEECITLMTRGLAAMKAETLELVSNDEGVHFIFADANGDEFNGKMADGVERLSDAENTTFSHKYPAKMILDLFRTNPTGHVDVGENKGVILFETNGLSLFILPQV